MTENPQNQQDAQDRDDRRGEVKPNEKPIPSSPEPDEQAVRKGEETLERVKPY